MSRIDYNIKQINKVRRILENFNIPSYMDIPFALKDEIAKFQFLRFESTKSQDVKEFKEVYNLLLEKSKTISSLQDVIFI